VTLLCSQAYGEKLSISSVSMVLAIDFFPFFQFLDGVCYVAQSGLELLGSSHPPVSASQNSWSDYRDSPPGLAQLFSFY
jgi:hypothetical protein